VSQDQGSGNALFPVIKKLSQDINLMIRVFAAKHSKKVFREQGIPFTNLDNKDFNKELDFKPDMIVTGASMRNCIEKEAILFARNNRIKTITILDFWSNYWQRFTTAEEKDITFLPDYIFVMDDIAKKHMITEGFPENKLIVSGNPYFDTFEISKKREDGFNTDSILYVSQPVYQNGYYKTEYSIFENILSVISKLEKKNKIIIRPHPKDAFGAYVKYKDETIIIDDKKNIKELIKSCDIVVGKNSTVLFEAVFTGKLVISYQPVEEKPDRLVTNRLGLSYLVRSKPELERILDKVMKRQPKSKKFGVIKYYNDGNSTKRVIKSIEKILY